MARFRFERLRQKFLVITATAFLVPCLFYICFLWVSLKAVRDLETETAQGEVLRAEAFLREYLQAVETTLADVMTAPGAAGLAGDNPLAAWEEVQSSLPTALAPTYLAGFTIGASREALFLQGSPELAGPFTHWLKEALAHADDPQSCCGLASIGGETFLVASKPVGLAGEHRRLVLAISTLDSFIPRANRILGTELSVSPKDRKPADTITAQGHMRVNREILGLDGQSPFVLEVDMNVALFTQLRTQLIWFPAFFFGAVLVGGLLGTRWATAMVLRPIRRLSEIMTSVTGPESYEVRAPDHYEDEIGEISDSFNRLMIRLEEAQLNLEAAQRRQVEAEKLNTIHAMVVTLAHQINNPLTALMGQAELLLMDTDLDERRRQSIETIRDMSIRIAGVIKRLQDLQSVETTSYLRWQNMLKIDFDEEELSPREQTSSSGPAE